MYNIVTTKKVTLSDCNNAILGNCFLGGAVGVMMFSERDPSLYSYVRSLGLLINANI